MIWLNWRQFRLHTLVAAIGLVLIAAYLLYLGMDIRDAHDVYRSRCADTVACAQAASQFQGAYRSTLLFMAAGLGLIPVVLGAFWGAPLIARELELGTHRLVWSQSVTRRRWLIARMAFTALAAMTVTGLAALMLTWAAAPYDQVASDRFGAIEFGARNIAPIGYAFLAFTLGTTIGLLVRRTLPAMAITGVVFLAVQFTVPNMVRPHLLPAEKATLPMTAQAINGAKNLGSITGAPVIGGLQVPGAPDAWISDTSPMRTADGRTLSEEKFGACLDTPSKTGAGGTFGDAAVCLSALDLHVDIEYQPGGRYWYFQLAETGLYFAAIPDPVPAPGNGEAVGVDRGVAVSAALSTGRTCTVPGLTAGEAERLKRLLRRLARADRGSNRRVRVKAAIARLKAREADRRKDWVEKTSTDLARRFDVIAVEDLDVRGMTRSARGTVEAPGVGVRQKAGLNRGILASGWGHLVTRLEHKAPGRVVMVDPAYTSQTCNACGYRAPENRESQAVFGCTACGHRANADVNAARNIRDTARTIKDTAVGRTVAARGGTPSGGPVNREPQPALLPA